MSIVEDYITNLDSSRQAEARRIAKIVYQVVPDAAEVMSYGMPTFKVNGQAVLGFAPTKDFLSIYPFSGSVVGQLTDELKGYTTTKSAIHLKADQPMPEELMKKILRQRMQEINAR